MVDEFDVFQKKNLNFAKKEIILTFEKVDKFDPDVFRQLMEFAHTGRLDLQPR